MYYSNIECSSCTINNLIEYHDIYKKIGGGTLFSPIIIFGLNNQYYSITSNLQSHGIDFPVIIDKYNDFRSINPSIPDDSRYHTFLLDRNNRVVLVGNPLSSDAMWSLFRKTLDNMLANDQRRALRSPITAPDRIRHDTQPLCGTKGTQSRPFTYHDGEIEWY